MVLIPPDEDLEASRPRRGDSDSSQDQLSSLSSDKMGKSTSRKGKADGAARSQRKWTFGILQDRETDEVPGSVLLLSNVNKTNAPLGVHNAPRGISHSSLPSPYPSESQSRAMFRGHDKPFTPKPLEKKKTDDGQIILEPQPDDSKNDPLNWSIVRRDMALVSLSFYCMLGGGMTTVIAAGFTNVAESYNTTVAKVALTTGIYMLGLGLGSVVNSPTAILFGKRPVYLVNSLIFVLTAVWCALSPSYGSLVAARFFMGVAVSPVECLPSATIAEIYFLHERAYRLGVYTLLLLGGKNLIPLVSAAIINSMGWRWVFWIVAIVVGFGGVLLFFFVPETFWDRSPRAHKPRSHTRPSLSSFRRYTQNSVAKTNADDSVKTPHAQNDPEKPQPPGNPTTTITHTLSGSLAQRRQAKKAHFASEKDDQNADVETNAAEFSPITEVPSQSPPDLPQITIQNTPFPPNINQDSDGRFTTMNLASPEMQYHSEAWKIQPHSGDVPSTPVLHSLNSPSYVSEEKGEVDVDYFIANPAAAELKATEPDEAQEGKLSVAYNPPLDRTISQGSHAPQTPMHYTKYYREQPKKSFLQSLTPYSGRLSSANWFRVALRPFILFAYPSILWSAAVYALSVGWLIVLSESVAEIYRNPDTYNFSALGAGLIYISPFVGGVFGTAVAGKVSDFIIRFMSRRNGGVYEPEFRLIMAGPIAISTTIGLMGYGWSVQEHDAWIVPTIFFGIISFGCCLGSTTAITFAVDSYRQYAGEALVTLNFSKNILHGFVFSFFFNDWLSASGPKEVFLALGGIQLGFLLFSIPMYIFGKRCRMWTVRNNWVERV